MAVDKNIPILIIDNSNTMRRIMRGLLKQFGFNHVDEAKDSAEALSILKQKPYGLVISEWNMMPISGLDLLKSIQADVSLKDIPFIIATTENKPENVLLAREVGVSNYIIKPFNAETLKNKLTKIFGSF